MSFYGDGIGVCPDCGKRRFLTRSDAKAVIRRLYPGSKSELAAYRCGDYWHYGHVGATVKRGLMTRGQRFKG